MSTKDAIIAASAKFPKPADRTFQYGTAGVSLERPQIARLLAYLIFF